MFERLEKRIVVEYEVKAESDLHIGSGGSTTPNSVDLPVIKNAEGYPIIPGSSLKGVLRSELQKLLNTQFGELSIDAYASKSDTNPQHVRKAEMHTSELFGGEIVVQEDGKNIVRSVAGSIRVRDAKANAKKTRIRDGVKININTRKAEGGAKFEIEVVPSRTLFNGEIYIENPRLGDKEYGKLGALLATIDFFNATTRALGGATSRGFGEVEIVVKKVKEFTPEDYLAGNLNGNELEEKVLKEAKEQWKEYILAETRKLQGT
ncbi:MAG: RAMP superfamily CRISPR-associated protein [Fervidicoccaceae archaeon]